MNNLVGSAERIRKARTKGASHRNDFALKGSLHDVPLTLVDHEWGLSVVFGILIGLCDNPSRSVLHLTCQSPIHVREKER